MAAIKALKITDAVSSGNVAAINGWAQQVGSAINTLQNSVAVAQNSANDASAAASSATSDVVPPDPSAFSASQSGYIIDGVLYSQVTVSYTAPSPLNGFAGIFLVVKGYRGSATPVKVNEDNFTGTAGGSQSFNTTLQRTGETVTFYAVAKNSSEVARSDWEGAPSTTVTLNGNATAPNAPTGLAVTSQPLGNTLAWNENFESNMLGYNVYRNTSNSFGTASKIGNVATTRLGAPSFVDKGTAVGTTYFYWVTAVDTGKLESSASAVASNSPGAVDFATSQVTNNTLAHVGDGGGRYGALVPSLATSDNLPSGTSTLIPTQVQINNAIDPNGNLILKNVDSSASTNDTTTSATAVPMSGVSQTIVTKGNKVQVILTGSFWIETGTGTGTVMIYRDGAQIAIGEVGIAVPMFSSMVVMDAPNAASHTYTGYWMTNSGTLRGDFITIQAVEEG